MLRKALISSALCLLPFTALAQDIAPVAMPAQNQDLCITRMAEFPTDDAIARYQFFKLVQDTAYGADEGTQILLNHYGQPAVDPDTPVLAVIEVIANPVLRQAAPEVIVASMDYLIDFAQGCDIFITGQMESLLAFDGTLSSPEFNAAIAEDALFLRQILDESLTALGADSDPQWSGLVAGYSSSLIEQRDAVEFEVFETEIAELETLFMDDLDGRLKRSNDTINSEMDREMLGDAVQLSNDMNEASRQKAKQERLYRLLRIFGGGR